MPSFGPRQIAVIGGGLAGLECAVAAAECGADVEVFEPGPGTRTRHVDWDTTFHRGDEKVRSWTSDNWGRGGLSERLGGRSLCYHGVLIRLDSRELGPWGDEWQERLAREGGLYDSVLLSLKDEFPELTEKRRNDRLASLGIEQVPQAARIDDAGRFEAYTPLTRTLGLVAQGRIRINRQRVMSVRSLPGGCVVQTMDQTTGQRHVGSQRLFNACVLAASAIGNVSLLASSLAREILTQVTDHFCVGAFIRLPSGPSLAPFRHPMVWSGFVRAPKLSTNIFFLERPSLAGGDRIVQIQCVIEQQSGPQGYSRLEVDVHSNYVHSHINGYVSDADRECLLRAGSEILRWAERLAGGVVVEIQPQDAPSLPIVVKAPDYGAQWLNHDEAFEAVVSAPGPSVLCYYEVPYGAFEHEACTHPMGGRPLGISTNLEVLDLPGVYVCGPGAFPRLGIANPALTIIAMSRWLGRQIATRDQGAAG